MASLNAIIIKLRKKNIIIEDASYLLLESFYRYDFFIDLFKML